MELITTDNVTIKYSGLYRLLLLVKPSSKTLVAFFDLCSFDVILILLLF